MAKTLIGTAITDANGEAKFEYLATGAGEVTLIAESDNLTSNELTICDLKQNTVTPDLNTIATTTRMGTPTKSNGIISGRGYTFTEGWDNTGLWQCDFEVSFDNQRYAGICFWTEAGKYCDTESRFPAIRTFEGSWNANIVNLPSGYTQTYKNDTNYATWQSGAIGWFDVHIKKDAPNHLVIWSDAKNKTCEVTSDYLSVPERVTCGGVANGNDYNHYGQTRIRNLTITVKTCKS